MFSVDDIYVYIFSWKKVTKSAIELYRQVHSAFPHVYFINCDEHTTITDINSEYVIQRDDSYYYGGQFETAIKHCPPGKILGCIVGDVHPAADWSKIAKNTISAFNSEKIGIVAPNVEHTWHTARAGHLWDDFYCVPNTDCTCWFLHPQLCTKLNGLPYYKTSNLGWGIDSIFIKESLRSRLYVARDYSTIVYQPKGSDYSHGDAAKQMKDLISIYDTMPV
jgi:hypothetical protein